MVDDLELALAEARKLILSPESLVRATAGGRRRGPAPTLRRVEIRPVRVKGGVRAQFTSFDERQAQTRNEDWGEAAAKVLDSMLTEPFSHWHVVTTSEEFSFRVTKAGKVLVQREAVTRQQEMSHDREKRRLVDQGEPFLRELGVTTGEGRVRAGRASKYHQVEEFVRILDASVRDALAAGRLVRRPLRVVDLGCGNAYLTFATYQHLKVALGLDVELTGVDLKQQAREHNMAVAQRLGWGDDVTFVEGSIAGAVVPEPVDIVLALHACDTATDDALTRAIGWEAELVLAAPCCHHDIQRQLREHEPPPPYEIITRHALLRERLGDVLTDALRAHRLRASGYRTDVIEFVDTRHTPRNVLLRGHRTGAPPTSAQQQEYETLINDWHLTHHPTPPPSPRTTHSPSEMKEAPHSSPTERRQTER